nr:putative mfs-type transporter c18.02 [Quercus suber]
MGMLSATAVIDLEACMVPRSVLSFATMASSNLGHGQAIRQRGLNMLRNIHGIHVGRPIGVGWHKELKCCSTSKVPFPPGCGPVAEGGARHANLSFRAKASRIAGELIPGSDGYAAFVVGFAIMTVRNLVLLLVELTVLPFLPTLLTERLHVPDRDGKARAIPEVPSCLPRCHVVLQWTAGAFEAFATTTLLTNGQWAHPPIALILTACAPAVAGLLSDASASRSMPFLISSLMMVISTVLFFVGTSPVLIIVSRAIQGASTTFTWVTGLAFLVTQVEGSDLGKYVGWTTVGVAVGEIIGPLVGGPIYDYLGHWAVFGTVETLLLADIMLRVFAKEKRRDVVTGSQAEQELDVEPLISDEQIAQVDEQADLPDEQADRFDAQADGPYEQANRASDEAIDSESEEENAQELIAKNLAWNWLGTIFTLIVIFLVRGALEVAVPLYLIKQYSWTPTKISLTLLTLTVPAAVNPVVGKFTSRQGPRWWSVGAFAICGAVMLSFANVSGHSPTSKLLFVIHLAVVGLALAVLVNSNQVAISVASQRFGAARDKSENVGTILSRLSPSVLLSGITTSWAAGILLGPIYGSLIAFTEDAGWALFCYGLGGLCFVAAVGSLFLWRHW